MVRGLQITLVALLLAVGTTGCPWWKEHGPAVKQGIVDCTLDAVKKEAPQFVPAVEAILQGKAPNWEQQLQALITLGKEATVCAIHVVYNEFRAKATPSTQTAKVSPESVKQMKAAAEIAQMAETFLAKHKWQPK
jgi:hypothetical protein